MPQLPQRQRSSAIGRPRHIPRDKSQPLLNDTNTSATRKAVNQNFVRIPSLEAKYTHFEEIGHGSQGRIYRAVQRSNDQMVVVKQLNVQSISTWKEYELFQREAKVLESMDIDGVAKFYEAIECLDDDPPCAYIVEEYIQGKSLKQMLDSGYRFSTHDVYQILIQTLQILDKLHHHDPPIIHRDIKPSNLMISMFPDGQIKVTLIDFGAVANPQLKGGGSTVAGTFGYMPPEQLMGKPVPASDIYAIAATAVQLFTGKSPADLPVKDFCLIFEPQMQDKPHELVTLLRQMLAPKVENRLADIPRIIETLQNLNDCGLSVHANSNDAQSAYSASFERALGEVRFVCAPGNMQLWQSLPDKTPRSLPESYRDLLNIENQKQSVSGTRRNKGCLFCALIASGVYFIPSLIATWYQQFDYPQVRDNGTWWLSLILLSIGTFVLIFLGITFSFKRETRELTIIPRCVLPYEMESNAPFANIFRNLFQNGRKTIATIIDIQYLPAYYPYVAELNSKGLDLRTMDSQARLEISPGQRVHSYFGSPDFIVTYAFNPPDDVRTNDIIHSFITHAEPENHYQIGDSLPILYSIEKKHNGADTVTSMPFPFPLTDCAPSELIDQSDSDTQVAP